LFQLNHHNPIEKLCKSSISLIQEINLTGVKYSKLNWSSGRKTIAIVTVRTRGKLEKVI